MKAGVVVAADEALEWLLPWWWARYSRHNAFSVAFIDFGLSYFGQTFCKDKGILLKTQEESYEGSILDSQREKWEGIYGKALWKKRRAWLKKPSAMLQSPFELSLWLDLDCEVLKSLQPLFEQEGDVLLARETERAFLQEVEHQTICPDETLYNSGVIRYKQGSPLIEQWAKLLRERQEEFWGDQQALSKLIAEENFQVEELAPEYNWRMSQGVNFNAAIVHWAGSWGKEYIRRYRGIGEAIYELPSF